VDDPAGPHAAGLHVRAGNSMSRTREGLLDGALSCIERDGLSRLTMSRVAARAGVAKATLYNHFRTRGEVLEALVAREVSWVADQADSSAAAADAPAAAPADRARRASAGLERAAAELADHPALRRVAHDDPAALLPLLTSAVGHPAGPVPADQDGAPAAKRPAADVAAARLGELLGVPADDPVTELAVRWLVSQLLDPQEPGPRRRAAAVIAAAACAGATSDGR
jgi:AcrR family transcriptional regulator